MNLTSCSSGFTLFPVVKQKQCNDTYDVCIKGCPARQAGAQTATTPIAAPNAADRLKRLDNLLKSGAISKDEYETKRKEILETL